MYCRVQNTLSTCWALWPVWWAFQSTIDRIKPNDWPSHLLGSHLLTKCTKSTWCFLKLTKHLETLHVSSREPGIKRSRSFLCLFFIFTAQKCPVYQSSVSLKCPYSWWRHKHYFRPLTPVPQVLLSSPGLLCLSSVSPPCWIVSLCRGFVLKSKPANAHKQRYFADLEGLFVCHQKKGWFCWLALWKAHAFDSEWCYGSQLCFFTPQWLSQPLRAKPRYVVFHCQKAWQLKAAWAHNSVLFHHRVSCSWYQFVEVVRDMVIMLACF